MRDLKIPFKFGREADGGFPYEGVLEYADNKVIRPASVYIGPSDRTYAPIEDRA